MFERILLPLDGSEVAEAALSYGEELAGRLGAELILYFVHGPEQHKQEHAHQAYLDRLAETMRRNTQTTQPGGAGVKVTSVVDAGEPARNICSLADRSKADLIVMTAASASAA